MVNYLSWKDEYSVSAQVLDSQHKQIFAIINELYNCVRNNSANIPGAIVRMRVFSESHLNSEEVYQKYAKYPGLEEHKKIHAEFVAKLNTLLEQFFANQVSGDELLIFLKDWWKNHVISEDRKYVEYVKKLGM